MRNIHLRVYAPDDAGGGGDEIIIDGPPPVIGEDAGDVTDPVVDTPAPVTLDSFSNEDLIAEAAKRFGPTPTAPAPASTPTGPDPRFETIDTLLMSMDPTERRKGIEMQTEIAQERAEAKLRPEMEARINDLQSRVSPISQRDIIQSAGLGEHGQQALKDSFTKLSARGVDPQALMSDPLTREMVINDAKYKESQKAPKTTPRYDNPNSETAPLTADDQTQVQTLRAKGLDVTKEDIVEARRMQASKAVGGIR